MRKKHIGAKKDLPMHLFADIIQVITVFLSELSPFPLLTLKHFPSCDSSG